MLTIRTATLADRACLTEFGRRTFHDTFAAQNTPDNLQAYLDDAFNEERQAQELADPNRVTVLAENDGVLVGYAQLHGREAPSCVPTRESMELVRLYVDRSFQGRGVAQQLMQTVEEIARPQAGALWLGVWEHNPRAIAFYEKCGFGIVGGHQFKLGADLQTDHVMMKPLARHASTT